MVWAAHVAQATFCRLIKAVRNPFIVWEQPRGSWMYKLPFVKSLFEDFVFVKVNTHMCFFESWFRSDVVRNLGTQALQVFVFGGLGICFFFWKFLDLAYRSKRTNLSHPGSHNGKTNDAHG